MPAGASRLRGEDLRAGNPNGMIEPNTIIRTLDNGFAAIAATRVSASVQIRQQSHAAFAAGLKYNLYRATVPSKNPGFWILDFGFC